jgi:hypothetical protein
VRLIYLLQPHNEYQRINIHRVSGGKPLRGYSHNALPFCF